MVFTENGIMRIFNADDHNNIDKVSAFFGELLDTLCHITPLSLATKVLKTNVDLNKIVDLVLLDRLKKS